MTQQTKKRDQQQWLGKYQKKRLLNPVACGALIALVFLASYGTSWSHRYVVIESKEDLVSPGTTINDCSFEDLVHAFKVVSTDENQDNCWSLEKEIIRIPVQAILNRNTMEKLGEGFKGSVGKALIDLGGDTCYAALKTDHCHQGFSKLHTHRTGIPCVADHTYLRNHASYLGGEYTSALMHYTALRNGLDPASTGILSTWAVVTTDHPVKALTTRWKMWGTPYPDPSVIAAIMPLRKFRKLTTLRNAIMDGSPRMNSKEVARMMLGAAKGLEFMHSLGFAHQDVVWDNVAVVDTPNGMETMAYDSSYLAKLGTCTSEKFCNYCPDKAFSTKIYRTHRVKGMDAAHSDIVGFVDLIRFLSGSDAGFAMHHRVGDCTTATQLVQLLTEFAS